LTPVKKDVIIGQNIDKVLADLAERQLIQEN
jgi:hypothetical protein